MNGPPQGGPSLFRLGVHMVSTATKEPPIHPWKAFIDFQ